MRLTEEQKLKLEQILTERWEAAHGCWICGSDQWSLSERLFELREHGGGRLQLDGASVPIVLVTCHGCGNTVMLNIVALGMM
ncbi:MAG: hypothetical protein JW797_10140 [Bradymonadales bacterium]|nr:hypothetical protein [Bradymonadales bacterium]